MQRTIWSLSGGNIVTSSMVEYARLVSISRLGTSTWFLVYMSLMNIILTEVRGFGNGATNIAEFHVAPSTGRIHDRFGRERIFHGLNVVVKGAPWHPRIDAFDPQFSFRDADVVLLKELGLNVVRLGIMWPGVEPNRGHVNFTYLDIMQSIVGKLHSAGIFTLLEFHQDLYASQFCGEGFPSWILDNDVTRHHWSKRQTSSSSYASPSAVRELLDQSITTERLRRNYARDEREEDGEAPSKSLAGRSSGSFVHHSPKERPNQRPNRSKSQIWYPASFPEPLSRRWPWPSEWEKDEWEPSAERCSKHTWYLYYISYAVSRAFQDLYDNKWGWGDLLARYWTVVAGAFKNQPGVLGYELINEPWPGDVFYDPLLFLPGVADAKNLARLYEKLQSAVRSVDCEKILFFETITFDNFRCGLSTVPGGEEWRNKTVLSYHYYTPPNFTAKQVFAERSRESKRLGCGSMLTEFFISKEQGKRRKSALWELKKDIVTNAADTQSVDQEQTPVAEKDAEVFDGAIQRELRVGAVEGVTKVDDKYARDPETSVMTLKKKQGRGKRLVNGPDTEDEELQKGQGARKAVADKLERVIMDDSEIKENTKETQEVDSVDGVLLAADLHVQSWIGWGYKAFFNKTGSIVQQSLFDGDGALNLVLAKKLARTYPQSVCGNIVSFSFDPFSSLFSLSYVAGGECSHGVKAQFTEIFVQRQFYYPHGLSVEVSPRCASVIETNTIILVKHTIDCFALLIDVRISRLKSVI